MSSLDDLFEDLKEDLEKAKEEEEQLLRAGQLPVQAPVAAGSQATQRPQLPSLKREAAASAPVEAKRPRRVEEVVASKPVPFVPSQVLRKPPSAPLAPSLKRPLPTAQPVPKPSPQPEELVFKPAPRQNVVSPTPSVLSQKSPPLQEHTLFVGNLGPEVRDDHLHRIFSDYPSLIRVKAIMESSDKCKGYGFAYFEDPFEMLRALREKNGKLCGVRPMIIKRAKGEEKQGNSNKKG